MFACDVAIIKCKHSANPVFDSDLRHVSKWSVDNKVTVNVEACEAMFFRSKQKHDSFLMDKATTYQKSCR